MATMAGEQTSACRRSRRHVTFAMSDTAPLPITQLRQFALTRRRIRRHVVSRLDRKPTDRRRISISAGRCSTNSFHVNATPEHRIDVSAQFSTGSQMRRVIARTIRRGYEEMTPKRLAPSRLSTNIRAAEQPTSAHHTLDHFRRPVAPDSQFCKDAPWCANG